MNGETSASLLVLLAAAIGVVLLIWCIPAKALECKERPDRKAYHTYRIIDGQKCWYRGHRVIPKSRLYWPDAKEEQKPKREHRDPVFDKIRAQVKTVDPNELNEMDIQAKQEPTPFVFLSDKLQGWALWWSNRIGDVFK